MSRGWAIVLILIGYCLIRWAMVEGEARYIEGRWPFHKRKP